MPIMTKLRLRVFGSRASGENRENSDIDVLVEGLEADIARVKDALHFYSTEQGGPLDLFILGSVDNTIDLIAAYAPINAPRTIGVGDAEDLAEMLSNSFEVTLDSLLQFCKEVDAVWNQSTISDKISAKRHT